ncbi:MAG: Flagellar hook-length control protein FliK [Bacillota bacterium]|jgi:flagellar hook-length control protein FliK|nr:Flagellar hook-length control protein FliK [Bacillota bacterium]
MPSNNVIQNNIISADLNNVKVSDDGIGKNSSFLNLLSSLTSNKNENNKSLELSSNDISQNVINLIFDENIQAKDFSSEEDVDANNQNDINQNEISNSVNMFLLNNKQINVFTDLKPDINNFQNELKVEFANTSNPNLSDFKSSVKETEFNKIEKQLNLNDVKFNSVNYSEYNQNKIHLENKLLNFNGIQDPNMTIKIDNSNFDTRLQTFLQENNLTTYKQKNTASNNVKNSMNISINNSNVTYDFNLYSRKNSPDIIDNLSLKVDDFSENFKKSKIIENETNSSLNTSNTNINSFDKLIEITDESNKLNSAVMTQVKEKVNLMYNEKTSQVTMQLTPENLGKIDIKMSFDQGSLKVEITSFNEETNKMLNSSVSDLISSLKSNSEKPVEVIVKSEMNQNDKNLNQFNENNDQNYQNQKQRKNKYYYDNKFAEDEEKNGVFEKIINGLS